MVDAGPKRRHRTAAITVDQVVDTALGIIATEGYEALTVRRLGGALDTGPASLYPHVVNKVDLDELLIGRLCAELVLPDPDPAVWRPSRRLGHRPRRAATTARRPARRELPAHPRHAAELAAGEGHDRFDFTLGLLIDGTAHRAHAAGCG